MDNNDKVKEIKLHLILNNLSDLMIVKEKYGVSYGDIAKATGITNAYACMILKKGHIPSPKVSKAIKDYFWLVIQQKGKKK